MPGSETTGPNQSLSGCQTFLLLPAGVTGESPYCIHRCSRSSELHCCRSWWARGLDASCRERCALVCATAVRSKAFQGPSCLDGPTSLSREPRDLGLWRCPTGSVCFSRQIVHRFNQIRVLGHLLTPWDLVLCLGAPDAGVLGQVGCHGKTYT